MSGDISPAAAQKRGFWHDSPAFIALALAVIVPTVGWALAELSRIAAVDRRDLLIALLLLVLAIGFEGGATRIARLQWRMSSDLKRDMGSVWSVAAVVALPSSAAVVVVVVLLNLVWWRQHRSSGQTASRAIYAGATIVLGSLTAGYAARAVEAAGHRLPWALSLTLAVLVAIGVLTCLNRGLVTLALYVLGARGGSLLGSADENLTEFSTLCLGGLVAIAALHEPWLCVLAILPMVMLQRGSFVRELETAAVTDPKTGLINAVGWEHIAQRELARARRGLYDVSVLIIDIDHFKWVNDRHGHLAGDQVLREIAQTLGASLREYDTIGRFGGEEFVAVLPDAGGRTAVEVAERVRARVNTLTVSSIFASDDDRLLSVSVGAATARSADLDTTDLTSLLIAADRALYRAKDSGRNRVCLSEPDEPLDVHQQA